METALAARDAAELEADRAEAAEAVPWVAEAEVEAEVEGAEAEVGVEAEAEAGAAEEAEAGGAEGAPSLSSSLSTSSLSLSSELHSTPHRQPPLRSLETPEWIHSAATILQQGTIPQQGLQQGLQRAAPVDPAAPASSSSPAPAPAPSRQGGVVEREQGTQRVRCSMGGETRLLVAPRGESKIVR